MGAEKFHPKDTVLVVDRPYEGDKDVAGNIGTILRYSHMDEGERVYSVQIDGQVGWRHLYERDMILVGKDYLIAKRAKLLSEAAKIEKQLEEYDEKTQVSELKAGSTISGDGTVVVKVRENWWHWFSTDGGVLSHHSNSEDRAVVSELREFRKNGHKYLIHSADED